MQQIVELFLCPRISFKKTCLRFANGTCWLFMIIPKPTLGCQYSLYEQLTVSMKTINLLMLINIHCPSHCFLHGQKAAFACESLPSLTCIDTLCALLCWQVSVWFDIQGAGSFSDLPCVQIFYWLIHLCRKRCPNRLFCGHYHGHNASNSRILVPLFYVLTSILFLSSYRFPFNPTPQSAPFAFVLCVRFDTKFSQVIKCYIKRLAPYGGLQVECVSLVQ